MPGSMSVPTSATALAIPVAAWRGERGNLLLKDWRSTRGRLWAGRKTGPAPEGPRKPSFRFEQDDRYAGDSLAPADRPHSLVGGRLDVDGRGEDLAQLALHLAPEREELRLLADKRGVDIHGWAGKVPDHDPQEVH